MSNLIDTKHPFQIKDVKSINEYLFILKNILRTISQKGAKEKPTGINIPVRWSSSFNRIVVDFGSNKQRDISGIHLDNLRLYFNETTETFNSIAWILNKFKNCNNVENIFKKYNLLKNENRFLSFVVDKEKIYCTGLHNRCETSKRSGIYSSKKKKSILIDNSTELLENIQASLDFISIPEKVSINKSYNSIYLEFLEDLDNLEVFLKDNNSNKKRIAFKDYCYKNLVKEKINITKYKKILNQDESINDNLIFWFLIYHITLLFNHKVLKSLNSSNLKNIILYDNISDEFIKISYDFNIEYEKKEKVLNAPLMPVSF